MTETSGDRIEKLNYKQIQLAPRYNERWTADAQHISDLRSDPEGEDWSIGSGFYFHQFYPDRASVLPKKDNNELLGTEAVLYEAMKKILDKRKKAGKSGPAIFLDFGGMWGKSWLRIASKFSKEIARGEACFVVSNISLDPSQALPSSELFDQELIETV